MTLLVDRMKETSTFIKSLFFHTDFYVDSLLSCFASRSPLILLGYRGSGKSFLMETLLKTIDPEVVHISQGYLNTEFEDIIATLRLPTFEIYWKRAVRTPIRGWDEVHRFSPSALCAFFKLVADGEVQYQDKTLKVDPWWDICTANPWDTPTDALNVSLPEPLLDRFEGLWVPIPTYPNQKKICSNLELDIGRARKLTVEKRHQEAPLIWSFEEIKNMWKTCEEVSIDHSMCDFIACACRILGTCSFAQGHDGSSLGPERKRTLCASCNSSYLCSQILRPPSVRALKSWVRVSKGWAFLRNSQKVELVDLANSFPLVFWNRLCFTSEENVNDRLSKLRAVFNSAKTEIQECAEAFELIKDLINGPYLQSKYDRLKEYTRSKVWFGEVSEVLETHFKQNTDLIRKGWENAKRKKDSLSLTRISALAFNILPQEISSEFEYDGEIEIRLSEMNLELLRKHFPPDIYQRAKTSFENGVHHFALHPPDSVKWAVECTLPETCTNSLLARSEVQTDAS